MTASMGPRARRTLRAPHSILSTVLFCIHGRWPAPIAFLHRRCRRWQQDMST